MECLAGAFSLPEQCRIFQDEPGEWKGFADGWDPLEEGAMDIPDRGYKGDRICEEGGLEG